MEIIRFISDGDLSNVQKNVSDKTSIL